MCAASDPFIEADIVYVVARQVDVCYQARGGGGRRWLREMERRGGILLMHSLIFSSIAWLISSQTVMECAGVQAAKKAPVESLAGASD